jgi:hypothetical protein
VVSSLRDEGASGSNHSTERISISSKKKRIQFKKTKMKRYIHARSLAREYKFWACSVFLVPRGRTNGRYNAVKRKEFSFLFFFLVVWEKRMRVQSTGIKPSVRTPKQSFPLTIYALTPFRLFATHFSSSFPFSLFAIHLFFV